MLYSFSVSSISTPLLTLFFNQCSTLFLHSMLLSFLILYFFNQHSTVHFLFQSVLCYLLFSSINAPLFLHKYSSFVSFFNQCSSFFVSSFCASLILHFFNQCTLIVFSSFSAHTSLCFHSEPQCFASTLQSMLCHCSTVHFVSSSSAPLFALFL